MNKDKAAEAKKSISESLEVFFEKIEKLSQLQRILISSGFFLVFIGVFVYFSYIPKLDNIKNLNTQLTKLKKELAIQKKNARDLKKYQQMMKEEEAEFRAVMKKLPQKEEIPSLLKNISLSGTESGLEFLLWQPKKEVRKDFYAEIPVEMKIEGSYFNVALFFDRVARLNRVVNIENIVMNPIKQPGSGDTVGGILNTTCTAVTYKFVEPIKKTPKRRGRRGAKRS